MAPLPPLQALQAQPERFRFDAAFRLLQLARPQAQIGFSAPASLAQPMAEVTAATPGAEGEEPHLLTPLLGLIGPSGVMPRWYTELVAHSLRARARGLADFLDMLAQRLVLAFARAGEKYRLPRSAEAAAREGRAEPVGEALLALTGYGLGGMAARLTAGPDALRYYAGFMAAQPRAADRLASMVSDYLGRRVEVVEFAGAWSAIAPDQRTRLPRGRGAGAFCALGRDAAIGIRVWDQQARFILRVGPLSRADFEALLPDRKRLAALVSLVRAYAGWEHDFAVNLVLLAPQIPQLQLAGPGVAAPRLGWTSWLPAAAFLPEPRLTVADAIFDATLVEKFDTTPA